MADLPACVEEAGSTLMARDVECPATRTCRDFDDAVCADLIIDVVAYLSWKLEKWRIVLVLLSAFMW